jgi:hypothetical protein
MDLSNQPERSARRLVVQLNRPFIRPDWCGTLTPIRTVEKLRDGAPTAFRGAKSDGFVTALVKLTTPAEADRKALSAIPVQSHQTVISAVTDCLAVGQPGVSEEQRGRPGGAIAGELRISRRLASAIRTRFAAINPRLALTP